MKLTSDPTRTDGDRESTRAAQLELARTVVVNQLAARDRSSAELRRAISRRGIPQDVADEVLDRFGELGLVDDAAFAASLTSSRVAHSLRGRYRIRQELAEKGVSGEQVSEALAELDPEAERDAARKFAQKRARALAGVERRVAYRRLGGALARRGFPADIVEQVLAEVLSEWGSANL